MEIVKGQQRLVWVFYWFGFVVKFARNWQGVKDNWMEFIFFCETFHPILVPTYFSFGGLFNIQKYSEPLGDVGLGPYCMQLTSYDLMKYDVHHFGADDNFTVQKDKLGVIDYGSAKMRRTVLSLGSCLYDNFNLEDCLVHQKWLKE